VKTERERGMDKYWWVWPVAGIVFSIALALFIFLVDPKFFGMVDNENNIYMVVAAL